MNVPVVSEYIRNLFDIQKEDFRQAYYIDPNTLDLFFGFYKHILLTKIEEADPESTEGRVLADVEKALSLGNIHFLCEEGGQKSKTWSEVYARKCANLSLEELEKLLDEVHAETLRITDELIKATSNSDEERELQKQSMIAIEKEEAILLRIQHLKTNKLA